MIKGGRRGKASTTQGGEKEGGLGENYRYSKAAAAAPTCEMPHVKLISPRLFSGEKTDCRDTRWKDGRVCLLVCVAVGRLVGWDLGPWFVRAGGLRGGLTGVDYAGF